MKKITKERRKAEQDLIYFLRIYNEVKGREGAKKLTEWLDDEIEQIAEKLKFM